MSDVERLEPVGVGNELDVGSTVVEELEVPVCPEAEVEIIRGGSAVSELTIEVVVDVAELSEGGVDGRVVVSTGGIMVP